LEQLKAFDSQLLMIIADGMEGSLAEVGVAQATAQNMILTEGLVQGITQGDSQQGILPEGSAQQVVAPEGSVQEVVSQENNAQQTMAQSAATQEGGNQQVVVQEWIPGQMTSETSGSQVETSQVANTQQVATQENPAQETIATQEAGNLPETSAKQTTESAAKENVLRLLNGLFGETNITAEDSPAVMLNKLSHFIMTGENVSKETLSQLFSSKDMQQFLRDALEGQMYLTPEEVADVEKVKKLYERLESKTQRLESLLNQAGLQETPLAQTVTEVRGNVEFMNQLNQAYTFVQIPLKMAGQNASGQLYVYTNKRDMSDPEKELTAFLHLDLDHLGSTDVSVKMLHKKVDTKFYMDTDEAFELVKAHMPELEERLRLKGFDAKIYVENEGKKVNFLDDFLKKDAPPTGQLHRYSFDVRA
ncbi:MAG: flagellar hook-length control protein FliK, partial [Agathobacter sp.]|nr:flagellar hook-length control protein FliK [Agathobacter sp.]